MTDQDRQQIAEAKGTIGSAVYLLQYPESLSVAIQALKDATIKLEAMQKSKSTKI
jgi:hypothetical protein